MKRKSYLCIFLITVLIVLFGFSLADDYNVNQLLFNPSHMVSTFNLRIRQYYEELTGESSMSTSVYSDLYLYKDYSNSDGTKVVFANTFKTFSITFFCENDYSYAEDIIIYADTSSLNKWANLPILMYAALIDDDCRDEQGYFTIYLYGWAKGNHSSPYYADTFVAAYDNQPMKDYVELISTRHIVEEFGAQEPTDTEIGWKPLWQCISCGSFFSDPEGRIRVSESDLILPLNDMSVLYLPSSLVTIESEAISNTGCEAIIIPDGCLTIKEKAFSNCTNLKYVKIPASVISIAPNAFDGSDNAIIFKNGIIYNPQNNE